MHVSNSQLTLYSQCPLHWKLRYIDRLSINHGSIHTLFGTAMHNTLQDYLTILFNKSIKEAESLDLYKMLLDNMVEEFTKIKDTHNVHICTKEDLVEFYNDGVEIIKEFKAQRTSLFNTDEYDLIGCEIPLDVEISNGVKCIAYLDVVLCNKKNGMIKIIDLKTATYGWNKYAKTDKAKVNQLVLYKYLYATQYNIDITTIDIEYLILKRKLYENAKFKINRMQKFTPASGHVTVGGVVRSLQKFVTEAFLLTSEYNMSAKYGSCKGVGNKNCTYCEFKNKPKLCDPKGRKTTLLLK
jgi:hypothetical protein